jgi:hypothetical protein
MDNKQEQQQYLRVLNELSKRLTINGAPEWTPTAIDEKVQELVNQGQTLPMAFKTFQTSTDINRLLRAGEVLNVRFDCLAAMDAATQDGRSYVKLVVAIDRNGKPEIRHRSVFDKAVPLVGGKTYEGKLNLPAGTGLDVPVNAEYTELEQTLFTVEQLAKTATNVGEIVSLSVGNRNVAGAFVGRVTSIKVNQNNAEKATMLLVSDSFDLSDPVPVSIKDRTMTKDILDNDHVFVVGSMFNGFLLPTVVKRYLTEEYNTPRDETSGINA